jgi:hypothetical protein
VDVALFSSKYAYETLSASLKGKDEGKEFGTYQARVETGVDVWYDLISMFYKLQNLLTRFATGRRTRELIIRTLQGNPYLPETQQRARHLLGLMQESYENVMSQPGNLLRPWLMDPERDGSITCPTCLGVGDYLPDEDKFVCRRCGTETPAKGYVPMKDLLASASAAGR